MPRPALLLLLPLLVLLAPARAAEPLPTPDAFAEGLRREAGYFPLLVDDDTGAVYLEIPADRGAFLFQSSLPRGVGSNDLGLDRGQLHETRLVAFERIGRRVLLRERNTEYRADSDNAEERLAVETAFATSVLWGFDVVARDEAATVIDYTRFLLTDSHALAARLKEAGEGSFAVDAGRSAPFLDRTRAFPRNTELEAVLTLTGTPEGEQLETVVPEATAVTVHTHHSLVALPEDGYRPRAFHPMSGFGSHDWVDYAQPLEADLVRRVIPRHRLEKRDPDAERSPPVEPIVYHVDPGVPEPIRSALIEGASWWNDAFEAAGYEDAFRVQLLPEDADPMDVRYNVIQWVHRSTRGWSYGSSVRDPRTGEILKGHVTLGSLRVRQDLRIARALTAPFGEAGDPEAATEMALARIRQLAAHEVGHTLGLSHNYVASADGGTSVMDYPHPRLTLDADGEVSLEDAYDVGVGAWDRHAIAYGYGDFAPEEEAEALDRIVAAARAAGLRFLSDAEARPADAAHPHAHLWDNGGEPLAALERLLAVRARALETLGPDALPAGAPYSDLQELFVPVYFLHRYQTEAAAHLVAGLDYRYALKGDGAPADQTPVDGATQRAALDLLLRTLSPEVLAPPTALLDVVLPKSHGERRNRESPPARTGLAFDAVTPAEAAAEHTLHFLLHPGRLARLAQQHAVDPAIPSVTEVLAATVDATIPWSAGDGLSGPIGERVGLLVVEHLLTLGYTDAAVAEVASAARAAAAAVRAGAVRRRDDPAAARLAAMIEHAEREQAFTRRGDVARMPPGAPI